MAISGLVITYNEEKNIGKCIEELFQVCDEVIVIDSNSNDDTVKIATEKGAKVYLQSYLGDGPQRTYGLQFCKNDWIMNLDADEYLDKDAIQFIKEGSFYNKSYDAYSFRIKNYLGEKLIDFSGWYPDSKVRFFNKKTASPSTAMVHQHIVTTNEKKVKVHILHYGWQSYEQIIAKKNQYSTWHAQQLFNEGKKVSAFKPVLNGSVAFVRCYFFKKGIFNGIDGFAIALIQAFFSFMKYVKLIRLHRLSKK
ncbi:glycosyltransferase family 2 protein [Myroides injenensis]|uniref:glycosyltransferase family 2 protein n=1 Tax=Myroides injenensis TaxID=1183151 RepID=UPI002270E63A|nr:glycosyltransferase family 2 protein [Myroides injenensis]